MGRLFYTADLHIGHKMVSGLRGFENTQSHDTWIKDTWVSHVKKDDVVVIVGDVAVGNYPYALDTLVSLPGKKRLYSGNHDQTHPMHRNSVQKTHEWLRAFEWIGIHGRAKLDGKEFLITHLPYGDEDHTGAARYMQWRLPDLGVPLIHGHTHQISMKHESKLGTPMLHVGIDATHGFLQHDTDVLKWLQDCS